MEVKQFYVNALIFDFLSMFKAPLRPILHEFYWRNYMILIAPVKETIIKYLRFIDISIETIF